MDYVTIPGISTRTGVEETKLKLDKGGDRNSPILSDIHNTSDIACNWSNFSSIYYYSPSDFRRFVLGLSRENEDTPVYEIIKKNFREGTNIKKRSDIINHGRQTETRSGQDQ
jgi:hypothetical protein